MNRESIEARDKRLLKSFRDIVAQKQQARPKTPPSSGKWILASVFMAALIAIPAWVMLSSKPETPPVQTADVAPVTVSPDPPPVLSIDVGGIDDAAVKDVVPEPDIGSAVNPAAIQVEEDVPPAVEPAEPPSAIPVQVHIADIQTCRRVENRDAVSPTRIFSLDDPVSPTVWMTVRTDRPPLTLRHVYFLNDERYCTVPLNVRYTRTRTWSRVTVNETGHLGEWRVDVVNESGDVLARASFEVVP